MSQTPPRPGWPPLAWAAIGFTALALGMVHAWVTVIAPDASRFTFDSAEYALAGRAWLETGRLVTPFIHSALLRLAPTPPFPLLVGHPLVPALDAAAFALFGPREDATLVPALLAHAACAVLVVKLALALAPSRLASLAAGATFALSPWALGFACEGRTEMPFAALLTGAFVLLARLPDAPRPFWLGVTLGLAQLARPVLLPLLPAVGLGIWLLVPPGGRWRAVALALAGFVPLASLTAFYKWATTGSPFTEVTGYLLLTGLSPEWAVSRLNRMLPPPDAAEWLRQHPQAFADKLARNVRNVSYGAWLSAGRWPVALAAAGAVLALVRGDRRSRVVVLALAGSTALLLLLTCATVPDPRMLFPLLPAGVALGFAGASRLADLLGPARRAAMAVVAAAAVLAGGVALARSWRATSPAAGSHPGAFRAREWRALCDGLAPLLPRDALIASDAAPWIAWYTRHPVTTVPLLPTDFASWPARSRPAAVVVTNEWMVTRPLEGAWREVLERRVPPMGYRFVGHASSGRLEAVVFARANEP
jgi:4-amino-4-deoxy-L-arabinose transferase-like glycosyltransferase